MMEFRREHDLAFTPGQVWAVLLDFEGHRQWNPYVRLELLHSDPIALRYWLRMAVRSSFRMLTGQSHFPLRIGTRTSRNAAGRS